MAGLFRHSAMKLLRDQQLRVATPERRLEQVNRIEALLEELEADRYYPFEYLCYRVTGFRSEPSQAEPGLMLDGAEARHDLTRLLHDLAASVAQPIETVGEPIWTVESLSRKFNVSVRTVSRWRRQGLVARRFLINGKPRVGFLDSSVARFVAAHQAQVERGSRFRHVTPEEREDIIRRARRLAEEDRVGLGLIEIARRIAVAMERSTETIRTTLRDYDRDHPDRPIFPEWSAPLEDETKQIIFNQHRLGVAVEVLAKQHRRTRSSIYRIINEVRAQRLLATKLEFIDNEEFPAIAADPVRKAEVLGPMPMPEDGKTPRKAKAPKGLPPYLASLYEVPLLSREQETHLFRKMNFLKYLAQKLRDQVDPARARAGDLDQIEALQEEALAVKNQIISANLRLVVSIAKRHVGPSNNFFDLVSDGNMSLIRAVEKFDFARGNKFSTYASWAIMKNFARTIPEENYRRDRFVTGHEEMFEAAADNRSDEHEQESNQRRMREGVNGMLSKLEPREQKIIVSRFGINGAKEMTLEQLGKELGITKERVRQIEARAQQKLRKIAQEEKIDLPI